MTTNSVTLRRQMTFEAKVTLYEDLTNGGIARALTVAEGPADAPRALVTMPLLAASRIATGPRDDPIWNGYITPTADMRVRLSENTIFGRAGEELVVTTSTKRPFLLTGARAQQVIDDGMITANYGFGLSQQEGMAALQRIADGALPWFRLNEFLEEVATWPMFDEYAVISTIDEALAAPSGHGTINEHTGNPTGQRWTGGQIDPLLDVSDQKFRFGFGIHPYYEKALPVGIAEVRPVGIDSSSYGLFGVCYNINDNGRFLAGPPEVIAALEETVVQSLQEPLPTQQAVIQAVDYYLQNTPVKQVTKKGLYAAIGAVYDC